MQIIRTQKEFEIKSLGQYYDLYVQSSPLLLADAFENIRSTNNEKYELASASFLAASGLAWQAALKKTKTGLDLLTDID